MKNISFFTFLALCLFSLAACEQAAKKPDTLPAAMPAKPDFAKIKAEIQAMNNTWAEASNAKDAATILAFYADDAITMSDDKPIITGKPAIKKDIEESFAKRKDDKNKVSFLTIDVFGDDKLITEFGSVAVTDPTGKLTYSGKYVAVWENRNGKWQVIREMSNDDAPEKK
jgi:uncharacterized protein (TIGR02246 family)